MRCPECDGPTFLDGWCEDLDGCGNRDEDMAPMAGLFDDVDDPSLQFVDMSL